MNISLRRTMALAFAVASAALLLGGCGGGGGSTTPTGVVSVDVTDAPSIDYAHVYITVKSVAFHADDTAGSGSPGWQTLTLAKPVTVDLAALASGRMYADTNGGTPLFSGLALHAGTYRQIRIFLAASEDPLAASASALGLAYNNEVQLPGDAGHYILRIPDAGDGIALVPESPLVVAAGGNVRLALDFNLNDDVVAVSPNGSAEYILKPRLGFFDMESAGAVTGTVSFGNLSTSRFVIKAEQVKSGAAYRVVRRWTSVDRSTGRFNLYPLPVFGNATTATYDILLRGRGVETAIVTGVKVHKGTTLSSGAVNLGTVAMQAGSDFTAQLGTAMHPTGSWMSFYQTVAGDSIPYEVRFRHLDPYTGRFGRAIPLSTGPIRVAAFDNAAGTVGTFADDTTSQGNFTAVANAAGFYGRGTPLTGITGTAGQAVAMTNQAANAPQVTAPATADSITATFDMSAMMMRLPTKGELFITHDGLIVDSLGTLTGDTSVATAMNAGGGTTNQVVMAGLPGGSAATPLPGAFYGAYAIGWGGGGIGTGATTGIDLMSGSAGATIGMK